MPGTQSMEQYSATRNDKSSQASHWCACRIRCQTVWSPAFQHPQTGFELEALTCRAQLIFTAPWSRRRPLVRSRPPAAAWKHDRMSVQSSRDYNSLFGNV